MKMWRVVEIVLVVIGLLFMGAGQFLNIPTLAYVGVFVLGLAACVFGLDGAVHRQVVLPSRYSRRLNETYRGLAGIAYGALIMAWGFFFMALSGLLFFNTGEQVFHGFVRRPGIPLILFGMTCGLSAAISFIGSVEEKQGSRFDQVLNLLSSRLLPGVILTVVALAFCGLGVLEVIAPTVFDGLGGGFLELLFLTE